MHATQELSWWRQNDFQVHILSYTNKHTTLFQVDTDLAAWASSANLSSVNLDSSLLFCDPTQLMKSLTLTTLYHKSHTMR